AAPGAHFPKQRELLFGERDWCGVGRRIDKEKVPILSRQPSHETRIRRGAASQQPVNLVEDLRDLSRLEGRDFMQAMMRLVDDGVEGRRVAQRRVREQCLEGRFVKRPLAVVPRRTKS